MKKVLFISTRLNEKNKNGAYIVSKRNYDIISSLYHTDTYLIKDKKSTVVFDFFNNRMESIKRRDERNIITLIENKKYDFIFYDTSLFGYLVENIKKKFPEIKNIIFCHDISKYLFESIFKEDTQMNSFKILRGIKRKIFLKNIEKNEKKSFENSDKIIVLNDRENKLLQKFYKCSADAEIPISIEDKFIMRNKNKEEKEDIKIIFVGVADFFPNIQGIRFFIDKVLPMLRVKLYVIGRNMEKYKYEFEKLNSNVNVLGTVDDLEEYYSKCNAVIAPIFSGGGMKVKTAEALMYAKTIFGTNEAFEGYDIDISKVGALCNSAEEFIYEIKKFCEKKLSFENEYSRKVFIEKYSYEASKIEFIKLFKMLEDDSKC